MWKIRLQNSQKSTQRNHIVPQQSHTQSTLSRQEVPLTHPTPQQQKPGTKSQLALPAQPHLLQSRRPYPLQASLQGKGNHQDLSITTQNEPAKIK